MATINLDWSLGPYYERTLTEATTITFTDPSVAGTIPDPFFLRVRIKQGGLGLHVVTWPSIIVWANDTVPTLSLLAGKSDIIEFYYVTYTDESFKYFGKLYGQNY